MTLFPTALDTFASIAPTSKMNDSGVEHDVQHTNIDDAIRALQAKVGIDSSAVTTSFDYRIRALEGGGGGGAVASVNSHTGVVVLTTSDVGEGSNQYFTNARARAAISITSPLTYNSTTGVMAIQVANGSQPGYLASADWTTFNGKENALTFSAPLARSVNTISMHVADSSHDGYLSQSDWATFNGKQAALTIGNITEATSSVLTVSNGSGAVIGAGVTIQVKQAGSGQSGYLSNTDWNTFNSKGSVTSVALTVPGIFTVAGSPITTNGTLAISLANQTANLVFAGPTTGSAAAPTFRAMVAADLPDITSIVRGDVSATSPVSYNSSSGVFSMAAANGSTNGYLTSADWNTFNGKQASLSLGNLTESTSSVLTISGGSNAIIGSGLTIQVKLAGSGQSGYLAQSDWTAFNNKLDKAGTNAMTGSLTWGVDNTNDIGANGATRPRTGYFGTSVITPALQVSTSPTAGYVLTSDASGNATWQALPAGNASVPLVGGTMTGTLVMNQGAAVTAISSTTASVTGSGSTAFMDIAATWNTSGNPAVIRANVTNTASGATAYLVDLKVGGNTKFHVDVAGLTTCVGGVAVGGAMNIGSSVKDGLLLQNTTAATNIATSQNPQSIHFLGQGWSTVNAASQTVEYRLWASAGSGGVTATGYFNLDYQTNGNGFNSLLRAGMDTYDSNAGFVQVCQNLLMGQLAGSNSRAHFEAFGDLYIQSNVTGSAGNLFLGIASEVVSIGGNAIVTADLVELRDGTTAQTLNVYGTFTDSNNYRRLSIYGNTQHVFIDAAMAGTGTSTGDFFIRNTGNHRMVFNTNGSDRWQILGDGTFGAQTDNALDIGATASKRPRTGYFGTSVITPALQVTTGAVANAVLTSDGAGNATWQTNAPDNGIKAGNYAGIAPSYTPTSVGCGVDTSNGAVWFYFGGSWKDTGLRLS